MKAVIGIGGAFLFVLGLLEILSAGSGISEAGAIVAIGMGIMGTIMLGTIAVLDRLDALIDSQAESVR